MGAIHDLTAAMLALSCQRAARHMGVIKCRKLKIFLGRNADLRADLFADFLSSYGVTFHATLRSDSGPHSVVGSTNALSSNVVNRILESRVG